MAQSMVLVNTAYHALGTQIANVPTEGSHIAGKSVQELVRYSFYLISKNKIIYIDANVVAIAKIFHSFNHQTKYKFYF